MVRPWHRVAAWVLGVGCAVVAAACVPGGRFQCSAPSDCAPGYTCEAARSLCVKACGSDVDCADGQVCRGTCVDPAGIGGPDAGTSASGSGASSSSLSTASSSSGNASASGGSGPGTSGPAGSSSGGTSVVSGGSGSGGLASSTVSGASSGVSAASSAAASSASSGAVGVSSGSSGAGVSSSSGPPPDVTLHMEDTVLWGGCDAVSVVRTDTGQARRVVVEVEGGDAYAGPECQAGLLGDSVDLVAGVERATFYVRATAPETVVVRLKQGTPPVTFVFQQRPVRRRSQAGVCVLAADRLEATCPLPNRVQPTQTMLVVQPRAAAGTPAQTLVSCGLGGGGAVQCQRDATGTPVSVEWQTLETPPLHVEHVSTRLTAAQCLVVPGGSAAVTEIALSSAVEPTRTLVLFTASSPDTTWSGTSFLRSQLVAGPTTSALRLHGRCEGHVSAQLVQLEPGAVEHLEVTMEAASPEILIPAGTNPAPHLFLADWQRPAVAFNGSTTTLCDRLLAVYPTGASARVARSSGCTSLPLVVHVQRVSLPLGVVRGPYAVALGKPDSTAVVDAPMAQGFRDRLVWTGAQALNGQGGVQLKEAASQLTEADVAASALVSVQATDVAQLGLTLQVDRGAAGSMVEGAVQLWELAAP